MERDLPRDGHILSDRGTRDGADNRGENGRPCARTVDIAAANDIHVDVIVMNVAPCELTHNGGGVKHRVLCHGACRLIEPHSSLSRLRRRKCHGLNLNDRAEEPRNTEAKDTSDGGAVRRLLSSKGMEAAHPCNLVNILLRHREGRREDGFT